MTIPTKTIGLVLASVLASCGAGDSQTALEGIYSISEWTENETGCEAPGTSILASQNEQSIYIKTVDFFGAKFINVVPCSDLATCRAEWQDDTLSLSGYPFDTGSDAAGWTGGSSAFSVVSETCSGELFEDRLESIDDQTVQVTRRAIEVEGVPLDSDGFCDDDVAKEMARNRPCTRMEQITAVLVESLD